MYLRGIETTYRNTPNSIGNIPTINDNRLSSMIVTLPIEVMPYIAPQTRIIIERAIGFDFFIFLCGRTPTKKLLQHSLSITLTNQLYIKSNPYNKITIKYNPY